MTTASVEYDARPSPLHDDVAEVVRGWLGVLKAEARRAREAGDLPPHRDPADVAFKLHSLASGGGVAARLTADPAALDRTHAAIATRDRTTGRNLASLSKCATPNGGAPPLASPVARTALLAVNTPTGPRQPISLRAPRANEVRAELDRPSRPRKQASSRIGVADRARS